MGDFSIDHTSLHHFSKYGMLLKKILIWNDWIWMKITLCKVIAIHLIVHQCILCSLNIYSHDRVCKVCIVLIKIYNIFCFLCIPREKGMCVVQCARQRWYTEFYSFPATLGEKFPCLIWARRCWPVAELPAMAHCQLL